VRLFVRLVEHASLRVVGKLWNVERIHDRDPVVEVVRRIGDSVGVRGDAVFVHLDAGNARGAVQRAGGLVHHLLVHDGARQRTRVEGVQHQREGRVRILRAFQERHHRPHGVSFQAQAHHLELLVHHGRQAERHGGRRVSLGGRCGARSSVPRVRDGDFSNIRGANFLLRILHDHRRVS
jgi:hypothetical protein